MKKEGKGNKPHAADALKPADIEQLWKSGALGDTDLQTLQHTLWWLIAAHIGTQGQDKHHKLRFGDFAVKSTTDRHEYVEFSAERGAKSSGEPRKAGNSLKGVHLRCVQQIHLSTSQSSITTSQHASGTRNNLSVSLCSIES